MKGIFYVMKKRMIAQFSYGPSEYYENKVEAESAAAFFISQRKDADSLRIEHVER